MLDVVGVGWPNVDEDAYRDMATSLREFADGADDDAGVAHGHIQTLLSTGDSESLAALEQHWKKVQGKHKDLGKAARTIAGALDRVADIIVARKIAAVGELADLAASVGITLALAPVTGGLSTLLGAAKIAATRVAFKRILKEMADAAVAEIVAVLAEPAVAALENVAADLAIQTALNVVGVQDGYDSGQTAQAARDGMQLASAGAAGGGAGAGGGPKIDHAAHERAGTHLNGVQVAMRSKTGPKLGKAKGHHGRAKGKDSLTAALDQTVEGVMEKLTKAFDDIGNHVGKTLPGALTRSSRTHKNTDQDVRDSIKRIDARDGKGDKGDARGRAGGPEGRRGGGEDRGRVRPSLRDALRRTREAAISLRKRRCKTDPVDVASGDMVLSHTDLALPGALPLVLRRTHVSSYRFGLCFGVSWASTLDERLEPCGAGAAWAREDGSVLIYPELPTGEGQLVWPLEGDRLPLTFIERNVLGEVTYAISEPQSGLRRFFSGSPYQAGGVYWLREMEDRNGNGLHIVRGEDGLPTAVVHDGGYRVLVRCDQELGRVTGLSLRTPDGPVEVASFGYSAEGHLEAVTNSSGLPLRFTYDTESRVTSWTDRNGSAYQYVYDAAGRVSRTVGPDGFLSSSFAYGEAAPDGHRITRFTDSTGAVTEFLVSPSLQVVAETDPLGHTTRFEFDAFDRLLGQTDALGRTTRLERDADGNVVGVIAPDGVRTTARYNAMHLPVEVIERGGRRFYYAYDDRGNLVASVDPSGARTEYEYNHLGHLVAVHDALGRTTRIAPTRAGLPGTVTGPDGGSITCERDPFGRVTVVTDAVGGRMRQAWSVEGRLLWRELPDGSREAWSWDGEGNLVSRIDRMGRTYRSTSTHFDRLASTHTADGEYRFAHDTELRLTKVTNAAGLEWHYRYDAAGRLISETDFDGRTLTYEHDAVGRLIRRTNAAGQSLEFERDALGRVTQLRHDDGSVSAFQHDEAGHLAETVNRHAHIQLQYDAAGRVISETVNGRTMTFSYDALGRRTHRRTPSGATSTLEYNGHDLATYTAGDHTFRFRHDALGRETARILDGRLTLTHTWDGVGRLTGQVLSTASADIVTRAFTYQADGSPVHIDDSLAGSRTFTLDAAGRITGVQAHGWSETYAYNALGDQVQAVLPARAAGQHTAGERTYDGTRVTSAGRTHYTYDAQGRITYRRSTTLSGKRLEWRFQWDAEDRLTHVEAPGGARWRYLYDALGRRLAKERLDEEGNTQEITTYCWDGAQLAEQSTGDTTLVWDYAGMRPLCQREAKKSSQAEIDRRFFAIVTDLTGCPSELVSLDGSIAWRSRSTAWGATQWTRNSTAYTPLRQPGQYFDPETNLHYNYNRYYDPALGRYISPDPLGLAPAINHYAYVSNPFTHADPLGLAGCVQDPTWGGRVRFTQDAHGRPYEMNAIITRDMLDQGTDARSTLKPPGFLGGDYNQARGHMLARMLGGSGDILENLFTITQNPTNSPDMRDWEQAIYDAVKYKNKIVTYNVYLEYSDDLADSVPMSIQLEAFDQHGKTIVDTILDNPAHAQQQRHRQGLLP
ncbi:RHS repeat-associated core domain-containing protein [Streptomyces sp. NPDC050585]|uniref:RHS repeat-associated core domain-containing protein n=1 Tax=Streptomyces sp. NPDC050585 TaxID=3365632 RepID=UPI0037A38BE4